MTRSCTTSHPRPTGDKPRSQPGLPPDLDHFHRQLQDLLAGDHPWFSFQEQLWLMVFRVVAAKFDQLSEDESFALSFDALRRCHARDKAGRRNYLTRACINTHIDWLRTRRKRFYPYTLEEAVDPRWDRVDARLDLEDALRKLGKENPFHETVLRMRRESYTHKEIAAHLRVSKRHAIRLTKEAERRLGRLLGDGYGQL